MLTGQERLYSWNGQTPISVSDVSAFISMREGSVYNDVSLALTANSTGSAAANTTAIQNAIIAAQSSQKSIVAITLPGVYYINQVVMYSYTSLYIGAGVTIRKPASYAPSMFINYGALQATPSTDTDISFYGPGTIDGNSANQTGLTGGGTGILTGVQGEIAMIGVNNFTCEVRYPYNCNGFFVQWIGQNARFANMIPNLNRDFIHINGPSSHIEIVNCSGYSNDDFIALNAWDWRRSGPTVGDIDDVRIRDCAYYGATGLNGVTRTGNFVKFLPGTRPSGYGAGTGNVRNISVDGFAVKWNLNGITPASVAFSVLADYDQIQGSEFSGVGTVENVTVSNGYCTIPNTSCGMLGITKTSSVAPASADGQNTLTVKNMVWKDVHADCSVGSSNGGDPVLIGMAYQSCYLMGLKFEDCQWTPGVSSSNQKFINFANKTPADAVTIDGLTINSNTATGPTAAILVNQYSAGNAAVINDLTVDRIKTAPGYQIPSAWLLVNGVVNNLRSRGNYIVGPNGGSDGQGIVLGASTAQIVYGKISDSYFNGVKEGLQINTAVSAGVAATLVFDNCQIVNQVHPVFVNGAYSADITYVGGAINTGTNLARVASGAATLSYSDGQATGAGSSTVTLVSSGTIRLRKTDRIAISPTLVLSPQNNDIVNFSGTPSYTGVNVISGTGAGLYAYRGTGTVGWIKLN